MRSDRESSPRVRLQLSTTAQPDAVRRARGALEAFDELQANSELAYEVQLLVSELVSNAVTHGSGGDGEQVELVVDLSDRRLRVEVSDGGAAFTLGEKAEPPEPEESSGRGLYLLRTLADRCGVDDQQSGGHVWFEIDLAQRRG